MKRFLHFLFTFFLVFLYAFNSSAQNDSTQRALDYYVSGEKLRETRHYKQAAVAYTKALELDPSNKKYMFNKCLCFYSAQRYKTAIPCFEKILEVDKNHSASYEMIANTYKLLNEPDKAIATYQTAFETAAEDDLGGKFVYQFMIIDVLFREGKVKEAGDHITVAQGILPGTDDMTHLQARYENTLGHYGKALDLMLPIIENLYGDEGEGYAKYYFELGFSLRKLGRHTEADSVLEKAKYGYFTDNVSELTAEHYVEVANSYYRIYEFDVANNLLDTALAINPELESAFKLKEKMEPVSLLDEIEEEDPETGEKTMIKVPKTARINKELLRTKDTKRRADLFKRLCVLYIKEGNYEDAITAANECLAITPRNTLIIFYRGIAHFKLENTEEAESTLYDLSNSPRVNPEVRLMCYFGLAIIQSRTKQYKLARLNLKKSTIKSFRAASNHELRLINLAEMAEE
jgi:tetratricopeptide (TPR) repeat protein